MLLWPYFYFIGTVALMDLHQFISVCLFWVSKNSGAVEQ